MSPEFLPDQAEAHSRLKTEAAVGKPSLHRWSAEIYLSTDEHLKSRHPICLGPSQELGAAPHSYLLKDVWSESWIVRRGVAGSLTAHLNRCRHRGTRLLNQASGVAQKIVCPYHAWTYDESGACTMIANKAAAFPDLPLQNVRLESREVAENGGLLWLMPEAPARDFFAPLAPHLRAWDLPAYALHTSFTEEISANWKILQEAFLESYHVPFIHAKTLAPATLNSKWLNDFYGPHSRAVYALKRFKDDPDCAKAPLRRYVSVVYQIFPNTLISFQPFHALVTRFIPLSAGQTRAEVAVLVREEDLVRHAELVAKDVEFVRIGLREDFVNAPEIQKALSCGPQELIAGTLESQIAHFHTRLAE